MTGRAWHLRWTCLIVLIASTAGCNAALGPTRPDSNWQTYDSARVTLFFRPGSFAGEHAARLAEVLEDQYSFTVASLDLHYQGHIYGFLYTSGADAGLPSDSSGVGYADNETFRSTCVGPISDNLLSLISHEANHVIQRNGLGRPGTAFVSEGLASAVLSDRFHRVGKSFMYKWTKDHASAIPPLASLADDSKWYDYEQQMAYNSSASFLAWLLDTSGAARFRQIYYVSSSDFVRRFQEIYGRPLEDAERAWKDFCAQQPG